MEYAAGELDLETAGAVERHMAGCEACRAMVAEQAAVWKALDEWKAPAVSADFDRRLYNRIDREARVSWWDRLTLPFRPLPLRRTLPLTAVAGLLLAAGILLQHPDKIAPGRPGGETVRAEQVERNLDDLELLRQFDAANTPESGHSDAM